jgi:hypothetical protein
LKIPVSAIRRGIITVEGYNNMVEGDEIKDETIIAKAIEINPNATTSMPVSVAQKIIDEADTGDSKDEDTQDDLSDSKDEDEQSIDFTGKSYADIQAMAKEAGIKTNQKKDILIEELNNLNK